MREQYNQELENLLTRPIEKNNEGKPQIGSLDCYALIKPSFCHLFHYSSVTMPPHCALKVAKHMFKNKGYYH